jgi:hypothetical protein
VFTRQSTAAVKWTASIEKDETDYTRDDLATFREKLRLLCDLVDAKMAAMVAVGSGQDTGPACKDRLKWHPGV